MSGSWKFTRDMSSAELPALLRRLADTLEGRADGKMGGELAGLPVEDCRKLVLVAERDGHGLEVRLKVKRSGEVLVPTDKKAAPKESAKSEGAKKDSAKKDPRRDPAKKEKYRQLKKSMQADYKVLERAVRGGILPAEETLESFLSLSEIMVEMDARAHDDPEMAKAGAAFLQDALLLRQAYHVHDLDALAELLGRLERRRGACHAQFK